MTKEDLIAFTSRVKDAFLAKRIKSPVHLCSDTQAEPLIDIFKKIHPDDWLFCGWRNSFHCLLKGMSEDELFDMILEGRSMFICSQKHKIICSSIVGGILPIAAGVAMAIQRKKTSEKVWVCVGDMTARTGLFFEFLSYCDGHRLPVSVVIEDNGYSTNTPTDEVWGGEVRCQATNIRVICYSYQRNYPHVGVGSHVQF